MSNIKLARVDFRLIHGQVMTRWVPSLGINKIIVIDSPTFKNPMLAKVFKMAAPSGMDVELYDEDLAIAKWEENQFGAGNIMILFKNIGTAKRMSQAGVNYGKLQIGGTGGGPGKEQVYKNVNLSKEDYEDLVVLEGLGVESYMQPIPDDKQFSFDQVKKSNVF